MVPLAVAVLDVLADEEPQVTFSKHDHATQALPSQIVIASSYWRLSQPAVVWMRNCRAWEIHRVYLM